MAKGGFWDYEDYWNTMTSSSFWFDAEWKQRRDINQVERQEVDLQYQLGAQAQALAAAQKQVLELSMTVVVMAQILEERGLLDTAALHERLDAELEKLRPKPVAIDAHPHKQKPVDVPVVCARCSNTVPSSRTTITAAGTVCDACAERA